MTEKLNHGYDAGDIQVLEGLEPVRKRPGMYIGTTDVNSIDEALAGYCTHIEVTVLPDGACRVRDNGRGIPTGIIPKEGKSAVEVVLTKLHAGGKFGSGGYKISGGLHGVGVSCVNALSEWLEVRVFQNGKIYKQVFNRGVPQRALQVVGDTDETGTEVTFFPDDEIFDSIVFQYDTMKLRLRELAYLNKGLKISLEDQREGQQRKEVFCYEGGIRHFVDQMNIGKDVVFPETLYIDETVGDDIVEIAIQYNTGYDEKIYTYANNINTEEGGMHLEGFKAALTKVLNDYGQSSKTLKENEKLSGDDVREGLTAVLSVKLPEPQFEGQTKTKLGNAEMRGVVSRVLQAKLGEYLEENPKIGKELISKAITAQRAREAARKARESFRKGVMEGTSLPGKLADCSDTDPMNCEIFLVEGDSAGGTAINGRDRQIQAILPLRGKILNVEKARLHRILDNEEIKSMIKAFGCGYKDDFDISKRRYDRIICMTDADVDGSHIRILLLTFFYRFMRPLVEEGHVYIALPPLYRVTLPNKEEHYYYSDVELKEFQDTYTGAKYDLQRYKGLGEMSNTQLYETTMNPETRTLLKVTVEDAEAADQIFSILMGENPELRRSFIEQNADLVKELDV